MRPLKMLLRAVALLSVAFLGRAEGPSPEARTALVSGNADYSFAPLRNAINDAEAMAKARRRPLALPGVYRLDGTNPSGSKYHGMVVLTQDKDEFNFIG